MAEDWEANGGPCCAHQRVVSKPREHADGTKSDRWVCDLCDEEFVQLVGPRVAALERDLEAADEVIGGLGYSRKECPQCGRRAVVKGYICWHCGADPTMPDERCGDIFEESACILEVGHDSPHSDGEAEWGACPRAPGGE